MSINVGGLRTYTVFGPDGQPVHLVVWPDQTPLEQVMPWLVAMASGPDYSPLEAGCRGNFLLSGYLCHVYGMDHRDTSSLQDDEPNGAAYALQFGGNRLLSSEEPDYRSFPLQLDREEFWTLGRRAIGAILDVPTNDAYTIPIGLDSSLRVELRNGPLRVLQGRDPAGGEFSGMSELVDRCIGVEAGRACERVKANWRALRKAIYG